ncbi:EF-hand domain pair [Phytophthora cactorum]|nr:EF-hand domain pair [Phytophthora cactorum]
MTKHKPKQPDTSTEFSDALNREKLTVKPATKTSTSQPRGSKVVPGIVANVKTSVKEPVTGMANNKSTDTDLVSTGARKLSQPDSTAPGPVRITKEIHPEEDAEGIYNVLVQTRRCEELCSGLGLTMKDIRKMKRKYDANDMFHSYVRLLFCGIVLHDKEERRPLTLGILQFADVPKSRKFLTFDQYLLCVVNFAVLTKPELYQFVFDLYDDDKSGALDEQQTIPFPSKCFDGYQASRGQRGRAAFAPDDGLIDLGEFMKFAKNFPVAFYPIMNMQKNVRASTLGESRWSRITANKLKVQELVSYMRRHQGAIPQLTFLESVANIFSSEIFQIRKRAGELYALELAQRHRPSTVRSTGFNLSLHRGIVAEPTFELVP